LGVMTIFVLLPPLRFSGFSKAGVGER